MNEEEITELTDTLRECGLNPITSVEEAIAATRHTINIKVVKVPENRIRRTFPDKEEIELCDSIWRLGQLQPIVLYEQSGELVCGERRLRAMKRLEDDTKLVEELTAVNGPSHDFTAYLIANRAIWWVSRSSLTGIQLQEAELEENTRRLDLTWQEQARAKKALHALRQSQHGEGGTGKAGWTIKDTAAEIVGRAPTSSEQKKASDEILLADFLDDPMVAAAPDPKEAMKVVRQIAEAAERKRKAEAIDVSALKHTVIHGDCYELPSSHTGRYSCIITDPPYGRDMHKHSFDGPDHEYDDSREVFEHFVKTFPAFAHTLAAEQAHCYVFCDFLYYNELFASFEIAGWTVWPRPLIWDKGNIGSFGSADQGPRHCYDCVLFANKGKKPCTALYRDVIAVNQLTALKHPAGKPAEVYADLLKRSVAPGDHVLDPMVGGGTFFEACDKLKVFGTGVEVSEKYYHMAVEKASKGK